MASHVLVSSEHRFYRDPSGCIWTASQSAYAFWLRYLDVFDQVTVLARALDCDAPLPGWTQVTGDGVTFFPIPYYVGPWGFLRQWRRVNHSVRSALSGNDAVILRVPSPIAGLAIPMLTRAGRPYGVEVVGDPSDVFAPGAVRHPLRPVFRYWFTSALRRQVRRASAAAYVTKQALQLKYPAAEDAYTTSYSSIDLPDEAFAARSRGLPVPGESMSVVSVGSLEQLYKAPDVLIDAVAICGARGFDVRLSFVGDGKHRCELEDRAEARGVARRGRVAGLLPAGAAVREELDRADLFVLPSRTEGLPRAMIEAMALGLPCIGSTVGGIPELLPAEDLVSPGDATALADKILEVIGDPGRTARMSARNLGKAREYHQDVLRKRRIGFYQHVRGQTEEWMQSSDNRSRDT